MSAKHTPESLENKARAATARFARAMSKDPMVRGADALADALGGLLRSHSGCGDCTPAVAAARAALRAVRRLP